MFQYNFIDSSTYDHDLETTSSIYQENILTTEYSQLIHSMYRLRVGYTLDFITNRDEISDITDYNLRHQTVYLQNELSLPYDFRVTLRYDFHLYQNQNRDGSYYNLPDRRANHGGYLLIEKPLYFNHFSFDFSRSFFESYGSAEDMTIERTHSLGFSDDISIGDYVSSLLSFSTSKSTLDNEWSRSYTVHPRLNLPFFPWGSVEYEWNFQDHPNRQHHQGIFKFVSQIASGAELELRYQLTYYTVPEDFAHNAMWLISVVPKERWSISLLGEVNYYNEDISQNYLITLVVPL